MDYFLDHPISIYFSIYLYITLTLYIYTLYYAYAKRQHNAYSVHQNDKKHINTVKNIKNNSEHQRKNFDILNSILIHFLNFFLVKRNRPCLVGDVFRIYSD